jgi:YegS/Rv2252/BmrU family lipid kinase
VAAGSAVSAAAKAESTEDEDWRKQFIDDIDPDEKISHESQLKDHARFPPTFQPPLNAARTTVKYVAVIYNPFSGAKRGAKLMELAKELFQRRGVQVKAVPTEHPGHCRELCATMDLEPYDVLCVMGGDGTFHEAINGWMARTDKARLRVALGLIAGGTGNSFAWELYGDCKLKTAVEHICAGVYAPMDICRLTLPHPDRPDEVLYCFNSIHWGLGSKVAVTAERLRWMGAALRYTTAALLEMVNGCCMATTLLMEDKDGNVSELKTDICLIIANNIRGAAKGMTIAPSAFVNDGLIDLLVITSDKVLDLARILQGFFDGSHVDLPFVTYLQCSKFSISPFRDRKHKTELQIVEEVVDVDGELKGSTPLLCEVLPSSVRVII